MRKLLCPTDTSGSDGIIAPWLNLKTNSSCKKRERKRKKEKEKRRGRSSGQQAREAAAARQGASQKARQAQTAWNAGRQSDAIRLYERALASDPQNAKLMLTVARDYGVRYERNRATELMERADALGPNDVAVQGLLGELHIKRQDFSAATCTLGKEIR